MYRRFPDCAAGHENGSYDPSGEAREARYRLACVLQIDRSGRLLDVGCGRGEFLKVARQSFDVAGVDVASTMTLSDEAVPFFQGRLEDAAFEEESFHIVTAFEVLEHLFDPASVLRAVHRVLAPDGMFVFQTGDVDTFRARLNLESWPYLQPPVHLNIPSRRSLAVLMRRTGFRVVKAWSFGQAPARIMRMADFPDPELFRPLLDIVARLGLIGRTYAAVRVDA
jgi:SAM-dependent methyltransferase